MGLKTWVRLLKEKEAKHLEKKGRIMSQKIRGSSAAYSGQAMKGRDGR